MTGEKQYSRMPLGMLLLEASQIGEDDELIGTLVRKLQFMMNVHGRCDAAQIQVDALIASYEQ